MKLANFLLAMTGFLTLNAFGAPSLDDFLEERGVTRIEGHIYSRKGRLAKFFVDLLEKNPQVRHIGEIGFNAGHSSQLFLNARKNIKVTSFDIMLHPYVYDAKEYIDLYYPGRHVLIPGNSKVSVPQFYSENPDVKFDLVFVDGCHKYGAALSDILTMRPFAHKNTLLVLDDVNQVGKNADKARQECVERGIITEGEVFRFGPYKAWALCRYILDEED